MTEVDGRCLHQLNILYVSIESVGLTAVSTLNRTSSTQAGHMAMSRMTARCSRAPVYLLLLVLLIKSPPLVIIMQNLLSVFFLEGYTCRASGTAH